MRGPSRRLSGSMVQRLRIWLIGGAALAVLGVVGVVIVSGGGETGTDLPRVRVSIPGSDNEVDVFAEESVPVGRDEQASSDVIEVDDIDQIRSAFEADQGRPRLILLVDPI